MDGQEYLNQISAVNRPVKKPGKKIFSSKFLMIGIIGVVALILIIILGSILGGGKGGVKNLGSNLMLHINNTESVVEEFQPYIKSSDLRSSSSSLAAVLANTSSGLNDYLVAKYQFKEKEIDKKVVEQAELERADLANELQNAKINGILDRIFAHKMAYEITMIMSEETRLYNATSDDALKEIIDKSYDSLENLYNSFNDFSETNN